MLAWAMRTLINRHPLRSFVVPLALDRRLPSAVAIELVQFMAGLILSSGKDSCYA